jgi:nitrogen fixation negative regulator NifL
LLDIDGSVVLDNQEYKKLAGDMRGREPATTLLKSLQNILGYSWDELSGNQHGFEDEEVLFDPGGGKQPRWFSCSGTWFQERDASADNFFEQRNKTYLLLVANEITTIKRQQEEVRMNALRALQAEAELLQSMREALAGAVHQLQIPVNLIGAAANMFNRRIDTADAPLREALQEALQAGETALKTLSSSIPKEPEESIKLLNVNQLLRDTISLSTQRLLANGIVIDWQPAPVLPSIYGKEVQLRGVFKQIIDNAIEAMAGLSSDERDLRISTFKDGGHIHVVFEDTGPGIPEEMRIRIFEPFFTTKGAKGRAGMGLAMVQDIVNEHGGTILIDSDYSAGCRFLLQFPLTQIQNQES